MGCPPVPSMPLEPPRQLPPPRAGIWGVPLCSPHPNSLRGSSRLPDWGLGCPCVPLRTPRGSSHLSEQGLGCPGVCPPGPLRAAGHRDSVPARCHHGASAVPAPHSPCPCPGPRSPGLRSAPPCGGTQEGIVAMGAGEGQTPEGPHGGVTRGGDMGGQPGIHPGPAMGIPGLWIPLDPS